MKQRGVRSRVHEVTPVDTADRTGEIQNFHGGSGARVEPARQDAYVNTSPRSSAQRPHVASVRLPVRVKQSPVEVDGEEGWLRTTARHAKSDLHSGGSGRIDRHLALLVRAPLVLHDPVDQREQGKILAQPDIFPRRERRPDLPYEHVARHYGLPPVDFDPATLRVRVASVAGAACAFLVSHGGIVLCKLGGDKTVVYALYAPRICVISRAVNG